MSTDVSWGTVARPVGRLVLRRLPRFIFERFYSESELEGHIKVRLISAKLIATTLLNRIQVPSLVMELELFNLSPYLDVRVASVRSMLTACDEKGLERTFAHIDEWGAFDLHRGEPRPLRLTFWPNEQQAEVLSIYGKERFSLDLVVALRVESKIGTVYRLKRLTLCGLGD